MAESTSVTGDSDIILPYNFKPDSFWSTTSKGSDSKDTGSQASFTKQLGNTSWCLCGKCAVMPTAIECTCCRELQELEECFDKSGACVTNQGAFKIV